MTGLYPFHFTPFSKEAKPATNPKSTFPIGWDKPRFFSVKLLLIPQNPHKLMAWDFPKKKSFPR
jgi:hypothetical protein